MAGKVLCELLEHYNRIAGIEKRTALAVRFFAFADKAHDVGDKYLESFAVLLKGLPQEHCLVSRRSGDEFCIFICGFQDISEIQKILKELWRKLREEEAVITQDVIRKIRASGGVAYARGQSRLLEDLLLEADQALYEVKRENKGLFKEYDADKCQEA